MRMNPKMIIFWKIEPYSHLCKNGHFHFHFHIPFLLFFQAPLQCLCALSFPLATSIDATTPQFLFYNRIPSYQGQERHRTLNHCHRYVVFSFFALFSSMSHWFNHPQRLKEWRVGVTYSTHLIVLYLLRMHWGMLSWHLQCTAEGNTDAQTYT